MAFLNDGEVLNFNKKPDSILIMGKMNSACNSQPYAEVVFDVLTFHGVQPGREPLPPNEKRSVLEGDHLASYGLIYDEDAEGLVHFLHPRGHKVISQPHKRALADALRNQVATPPNEENYDMRMAAGSTDGYGGDTANAGDHPLTLFPELFTAPINIDPQADAPAIVTADVTTGSTIPTCNRGSIGCSCRLSGLDCDIGLKCDSTNKCMMESCKPGAAGCPCKNGNQCDGNNECGAGNVCRVKSSCAIGTAGCECATINKVNTCTDKSTCKDGLCLLEGSCAVGSPGCACDETAPVAQSCSAGFQCNALTNTCLAPRCKDGSPGCRCHSDLTCDTGFQCNRESGVCSQLLCPVGDAGCSCTEKKTCNNVGFKCVAYTQTGDNRCVAGQCCERSQGECSLSLSLTQLSSSTQSPTPTAVTRPLVASATAAPTTCARARAATTAPFCAATTRRRSPRTRSASSTRTRRLARRRRSSPSPSAPFCWLWRPSSKRLAQSRSVLVIAIEKRRSSSFVSVARDQSHAPTTKSF